MAEMLDVEGYVLNERGLLKLKMQFSIQPLALNIPKGYFW
jgi:hypothetical protein